MRKQTAVYWALESTESAGGDDFSNYGLPKHTDPVEITVRWDDVSEEFISEDNTVNMSKAKVFVGQDMLVGEVLMLGELTDITDSVNIKENLNAWEIRRFEKIPNIKATEFLRTAVL